MYVADKVNCEVSGVHVDVQSAVQCQKLCAADPKCGFFNFAPADCRCELLTVGCLRAPNPNITSGPKLCRTCPCEDPEEEKNRSRLLLTH